MNKHKFDLPWQRAILRKKSRRYNFCMKVLLLVFVLVAVSAQKSMALSRGYATKDQGLRPGMVVSLIDETMVERASPATSSKAIGIAQTVEESNIVFSSDKANLLVEISGEASAFVTNYNGAIAEGDNLSLSMVKGVLMKSGPYDDVFGVALAATTGAGDDYSFDTNSGAKTVKISKISISIGRKGFDGKLEQEKSSNLSRLGKTILGRDISDFRVILALILFFIVMITEGGLIYGAVSSSITSMGRNPMAKKLIRQELFRVVAVAIAVLVVGLLATYVILIV